MKGRTNLTLSAIKRLFSENNIDLAKMMDEKLSRNNVAIFGDTDNAVQRLESKINTVETGLGKKIDGLQGEMNERFDMVGDQLQEVIQAASEITDQKLKEFKQKYLTA